MDDADGQHRIETPASGDNPYLDAERRADQARAATGLPAALPLTNDEGLAPSAIKSSGRPATQPERHALSTLLEIDALRRTALRLAQREAPLPPAELEALLLRERVPPELRSAFRAVIGRHLRYPNKRAGLSPKEARELATRATDPMHEKPRAAWSCEERKKFRRMIQLQHKLHGRSAARALGIKRALGKPGTAVLSRTVVPAYLRGLWLALDQWGAARHWVSLQTFRRWRRKLRKAGDLSTPPSPPPRKRVN